ncbi:NAD(P)-dependent oxidoreductase [Telmatospirillum sp.]|uniref:NAD(P)-dependent oxidoreductase n=1 Tax=Telmatospirillum sp. TaxID=2079197 RepID=UPI0028414750|nr:NAD(P)-dependent oxidoreductase [Telmatospirillum sp.]MDR3435720.1 NAD(P)-dependent oxidoreductase [Telmatospirillum sp.]
MNNRVGVIGLGRMGLPIARTLISAGFDVVATSRSASSREAAKADGLFIVDTPAAVAAETGIILISVFDTAAVEAVIRAQDGILSSLSKGSVVVDLGTTAVSATRALADELAERGSSLVDAPVSGGTRGAAQGSLTIMAGGSSAAIEKVRPVFECLGRLNHMGPVGAGQSTKAVNQLILGQTLIAVAEGITLARGLGLDPAAVREALLGGFAESRVLAEHGKRMVEENFTPGGSVAVFHKDLRLVEALAHETKLDLPGLRLAEKSYAHAMSNGLAGSDQSAVVQLYVTHQQGYRGNIEKLAQGWWKFEDGVAS